jgi:parallel beta-helix repeat protein
MIKYALILPLVLLSFLLGYFASTSQREQVYAIALLTAVFVTAVAYLFLVKHQKSSDRKQTKRTVTMTLAAMLLFSALTGPWLVNLAEANMMPIPPTLHIYINSDGNVEPSTAAIQKVGNVYTFMNDLTNSTITVQRDNIVIDGNGFTISTPYTGSHTGITVQDRSNVTIRNVYVSQFGVGILLFNSSRSVVTGNRFNTTICVYVLMGSSYNQITGNKMVDEGYDVKGDMENNTMAGGIYGVILSGSSSDNLVFGNNITAKIECGINIEGSSGNTIYENNIANNRIGVRIDSPKGPDSRFSYYVNNTFYRNNFVDNTNDVQFSGESTTNFWDKDEEGNYWSNYTGADLNNNSIGNTPYVIDENNADCYPLIKRVEIAEPETQHIPEFPSWPPTILALATLTVAVTIHKQKLNRKTRNKKTCNL